MDETTRVLLEQLKISNTALVTFADATAIYLQFEREFEDGNWNREALEKSAIEREVYFDDTTSDYNLFDGIRSSMRCDLLRMTGAITDKIKVSGGQ